MVSCIHPWISEMYEGVVSCSWRYWLSLSSAINKIQQVAQKISSFATSQFSGPCVPAANTFGTRRFWKRGGARRRRIVKRLTQPSGISSSFENNYPGSRLQGACQHWPRTSPKCLSVASSVIGASRFASDMSNLSPIRIDQVVSFLLLIQTGSTRGTD